jgi:NADH-quinone oxidoreductase subunit K
MIPLTHYLILSAILFVLGLAIVLGKRQPLANLMGVEFILAAAILNLVAFSRQGIGGASGPPATLFIMILAVIQAGVALPLVLNIYRRRDQAESELNRKNES